MCHRMSPLLFSELQQALRELRATGRAKVPRRAAGIAVPDAYPGSQVPLFVPDEDGNLTAMQLTWGFPYTRPESGASRIVFNTRIETAVAQVQSGEGMWADAIRYGRSLVPVYGFYERWTQPNAPSPTKENQASQAHDGKPAQVCFRLDGHRVFLLACVCDDEHFSVVTTQPNAAVAPVHNRMPLVLGPGESTLWLGPDYASLADRSAIRLTSEVEAA